MGEPSNIMFLTEVIMCPAVCLDVLANPVGIIFSSPGYFSFHSMPCLGVCVCVSERLVWYVVLLYCLQLCETSNYLGFRTWTQSKSNNKRVLVGMSRRKMYKISLVSVLCNTFPLWLSRQAVFQ